VDSIPPNAVQKRGVPDDDDYPAVCQSVDLSLAESGNLFGKNDCHRMIYCPFSTIEVETT